MSSHRIQLRDCTLYFLDGLAGTGAIDDAGVQAGDTDMSIDTIVLNTLVDDMVPVGARFTIAGETGLPVHTVQTRTPASTGPTTAITFSVVLAAGVSNKAVITFLPQQLEVKLGDGDAKWDTNKQYKYDLDRGLLDAVRQGDDVPLDLTVTATWEHVRTGTLEVVTPVDAMDQVGGAAEWVSSSADLCEPYAVDVKIVHAPQCVATQKETYLFPDFRAEKKSFDIKNASIACSGKCNVTVPTISRG